MSFIYDLDSKSDIFEPEVETSIRHDDLKKKFGLYRSDAEQINAKYREAKNVIDRLREEINISREMEKSQRMRISSLKSRIAVFEEKGKKLYEISEKQRKNSDEIRKIDSNIINITNLLHELKEKFQTVISSAVKEKDVLRENRDLKSVLEAKEVELQALKTELKTVMSENEDLNKKYEKENEELRKEVEKWKSQENDTKDNYDNIINTYKQKILEYETIIENLEKERRIILGDYEIPQKELNIAATPNPNSEKSVTWADSTVTCLTEERENKPHTMDPDLTLKKSNHTRCQGHSEWKQTLPHSQKTNQDNNTSSLSSKFSFKQKPKLQFVDSAEVSTVGSQPQPKKRLYSQNSNHYIN